MLNCFGLSNILLIYRYALLLYRSEPELFGEIDRKAKLKVDGRFWKSIIRPTSGAVETENSLVNKELCEIRQRRASVYRSPEGVGRAV